MHLDSHVMKRQQLHILISRDMVQQKASQQGQRELNAIAVSHSNAFHTEWIACGQELICWVQP